MWCILLWNYRDTFFNLSPWKYSFSGEWALPAQMSSSRRWWCFVNTHHLLNYLNSLSENKANLFIGDAIHNAGPHWDEKLQVLLPGSCLHLASTRLMQEEAVPLLSHLALRLYNVTDWVLLYPIDDVYTGMCLQKLALLQRDTKASGHLI